MSTIDLAYEFLSHDIAAARDDIERLGLDEAAQYNAELASEQVAYGDDRWEGLTAEDFRAALGEIAD